MAKRRARPCAPRIGGTLAIIAAAGGLMLLWAANTHYWDDAGRFPERDFHRLHALLDDSIRNCRAAPDDTVCVEIIMKQCETRVEAWLSDEPEK